MLKVWQKQRGQLQCTQLNRILFSLLFILSVVRRKKKKPLCSVVHLRAVAFPPCPFQPAVATVTLAPEPSSHYNSSEGPTDVVTLHLWEFSVSGSDSRSFMSSDGKPLKIRLSLVSAMILWSFIKKNTQKIYVTWIKNQHLMWLKRQLCLITLQYWWVILYKSVK